MKRGLLAAGRAQAMALVALLAGCAPMPGDFPAREVREDSSIPPLRVEFIGKFALDVSEDLGPCEADPRNAVLCGEILTLLYGNHALHRVVAIDTSSGKMKFDSPLFRDPARGGYIRVREGRPVLLWSGGDSYEEPACQELQYEQKPHPEGAEPWLRPEEFGPYTVWSDSWSVGIPHTPLIYHKDIRIETASSTGDSRARFTKSLPSSTWSACVKGRELFVCSGSERDAAEILEFDQTGFKNRTSTSLKLSDPRIFALGDGLAVVGGGEVDTVEVFDPATPDRRLRLAASRFEAASDGRRLFICGDNGNGSGPFLCTGTPESDAWTFARLDQGWSPADGFFIAPGEKHVVFGWISGRTLVVFRAPVH